MHIAKYLKRVEMKVQCVGRQSCSKKSKAKIPKSWMDWFSQY